MSRVLSLAGTRIPRQTGSYPRDPRMTSGFALFVVLAMLLSGCATKTYDRIANYPGPASTTVAVVPKPLSRWSELPISAYYDERNQILAFPRAEDVPNRFLTLHTHISCFSGEALL